MSKPIFISCLLLVFLCTNLRGQEISLDRDRAQLKDLLLSIHEQTGYFFYYSSEDMAAARPVSLHARKAPLEQVLGICFAGQPLSYEVRDRTIVVCRKAIVGGVQVSVKGKVLNEEGDPLENTNVEVSGAGRTVLTNADGEFGVAKMEEGAVLVFSHVGYQSESVPVPPSHFITVILKRFVSKLDEVQVIAYGTTTLRTATGNVSRLSAAEIAKQPVSNPLAALSGRMPGVYIQQSTGAPGGAFSIQIRGRNSLRSDGNNPLYIVDGVQFPATALDNLYTTTAGVKASPLNNINPSDIESIEVLKDADATAIYGSRGANGVVLITTKKGKSGKTRVDIGFSTGMESITRTMKLMNTAQYLLMRHEAFLQDGATPTVTNAPDLLAWDTTRYTDWQKELIGQTAHWTQARASVSGGNLHTQFMLAGNFLTESAVIPGDFYDQKASLHLNLNNVSENEKFSSSFTAGLVHDDRFLPQSNLMDAVALAPDAPPVRDSSGKLNWSHSTWNNPGGYLMQTNEGKTDNLIANLVLAYELLPGLSLKSSFGYNNLALTQRALNPLASYNPAQRRASGTAYFTSNKISTWVSEPEISYRKKIGQAELLVQVGGTFQQNVQSGLNQLGLGFASDKQMGSLQSASSVLVLSSATTNYRYEGLYSRLNLNWQERYFVSLTARRDGSSRFGTGKQFGNFGALGLAWVFTKARWLKDRAPWLSFGKLRASYGTAGNDQIADYGYLDSYEPTGLVYQGIASLSPRHLANPDYSWETIRKAELGLQTGFLKDRLLLSVSYYQNRSANQLVGYSLPLITGFSSVTANLPAMVENSGWELELNTILIRKHHFNWSGTANISLPRNRLLAYPNLAASSYANTYVIGQSLFISKVYAYRQVDPQSGVYTFEDYNHDGKISSPDDRQYIQKTGYDFYGGVGNTLSWGPLQLDIFIQFVRLHNIQYISNYGMPGSFSAFAGGNEPTSLMDRWQEPGQTAPTQRFSQNAASPAGKAYTQFKSSDQDYTNASYARLKNLTLSYNCPVARLNRWHLKQVKIYLQAQNLLSVTQYPGYDPETGSGMPPLKTMVAGIQLGL
jgi:TonB-linked SusC/RagA family outer membrane protein